jgi:hypothetical protein
MWAITSILVDPATNYRIFFSRIDPSHAHAVKSPADLGASRIERMLYHQFQ